MFLLCFLHRLQTSSVLCAPAGPSSAPDVCLYVAGAAAEKHSALWETGGVRLYGYGDSATPAELQTKSSAHPGTEGTGECEETESPSRHGVEMSEVMLDEMSGTVCFKRTEGKKSRFSFGDMKQAVYEI